MEDDDDDEWKEQRGRKWYYHPDLIMENDEDNSMVRMILCSHLLFLQKQETGVLISKNDNIFVTAKTGGKM